MVPMLREQELSAGFRRLATQRALALPPVSQFFLRPSAAGSAPGGRGGSMGARGQGSAGPHPPQGGSNGAASRVAFRARAVTLCEAGLTSPRGASSDGSGNLAPRSAIGGPA